VEGIGQIIQRDEFWRLIYDYCGHQQWVFSLNGRRVLDPADVEREVHHHYAMSSQCAWDPLRGQSATLDVSRLGFGSGERVAGRAVRRLDKAAGLKGSR
jgi:hypothetical protein